MLHGASIIYTIECLFLWTGATQYYPWLATKIVQIKGWKSDAMDVKMVGSIKKTILYGDDW